MKFLGKFRPIQGVIFIFSKKMKQIFYFKESF